MGNKAYKLGWTPKEMNLKYARFLVNIMKSGIEVKRPKQDCKCHGRGYRGFNVTAETVQICPCILVNKTDIEKIIMVFSNHDMKRQWKKMQPRRKRIHKQKYKYNEKRKRLIAIFDFLND